MDFRQNNVQPGDDDETMDQLSELVNGQPYVLVHVLRFSDDGTNFDIGLKVGNGITDLSTIHVFLTRATQAVEIQMLEQGVVPFKLDDLDDSE